MRRFVDKVWLILTLDCDQASQLQSDAFDRSLRLYERLALRGHLLSCKVCRKLKRQLKFLHQASREASDAQQLGSRQLSPEAAARIQARLANESNRSDPS